jgi:hypothetical protein
VEEGEGELMLAALKVENQMRLSVEGQAAMTRAEERDDEDWMEEAARMQAAALVQVGLSPTARNLAVLRATALDHPELALYVRHNKCRQGDLKVGDVAPAVSLHDLNGKLVDSPLGSVGGRPHVIFAGSVS